MSTETDNLRERVEDALRQVYDPEIPVNIFELGLIYGIDISEEGAVEIHMTLTAPNCPAAGAMPGEVESRVAAVEGVKDVTVELVWDPPWDQSRMSEAAKLELGLL
jgi:FeS assembly SUF system protein